MSFALTCTQCPAGHYRDDLAPHPEWDAPLAPWQCASCGHPLTPWDVFLEPGEVLEIREHVLTIRTGVWE